MNANKMKKPILLVHGEADNNPSTFTLQTERYFQALKNLETPVRMVILPKEAHGYVAKASYICFGNKTSFRKMFENKFERPAKASHGRKIFFRLLF